jgi:hypothetical protein
MPNLQSPKKTELRTNNAASCEGYVAQLTPDKKEVKLNFKALKALDLDKGFSPIAKDHKSTHFFVTSAFHEVAKTLLEMTSSQPKIASENSSQISSHHSSR